MAIILIYVNVFLRFVLPGLLLHKNLPGGIFSIQNAFSEFMVAIRKKNKVRRDITGSPKSELHKSEHLLKITYFHLNYFCI